MKTKATIRFISGREERFEMDLLGGQSAEARLKEFVKDPTIVLQIENELVVIPATAIESITLSLGGEQKVFPNVNKAKRLK